MNILFSNDILARRIYYVDKVWRKIRKACKGGLSLKAKCFSRNPYQVLFTTSFYLEYVKNMYISISLYKYFNKL